MIGVLRRSHEYFTYTTLVSIMRSGIQAVPGDHPHVFPSFEDLSSLKMIQPSRNLTDFRTECYLVTRFSDLEEVNLVSKALFSEGDK